jgi:ketosteroid isomerase-like protein
MASENLDLVRSIFADWERGDYAGTRWAHPEIEFVFADGPDPGSWIGAERMAQVRHEYLSLWAEYRVEADEFRELDGDRVLVLGRPGGRSKTSGLDIGQMRAQGASLFHVIDGKVTKLMLYMDAERALADLDLAPQGGCPDS